MDGKFNLNKLEQMALEIFKVAMNDRFKVDGLVIDRRLTPEQAAQLAAQLLTECAMYTLLDEGTLELESEDSPEEEQ